MVYGWVQLLTHPFVAKYAKAEVDLPSFVHSVFDPTERLKDLSDVRGGWGGWGGAG